MKITFIVVGKTVEKYLEKGIAEYEKRLQHYCKFSYVIIPDIKQVKNLTEKQRKISEGISILNQFKPGDYIILLDELGKSYSSINFSKMIEKHQIQATRNLVFVVGGAYGFSDEVYKKADQKMSLSPMTFSHQMVRLFFIEQLYRSFTILKGEPYHHG